MRWSRSLIPTLKEDPADAEAVSHKLMVRGGFVRQLAAGIYVYLPLGQRGEVRLAKRWLKGVAAYGAQTATGGFSGYLVEVLVAARGSFQGLVDWLAKGAQPRRIALGPDHVKDDVSPLVVVDPVDAARNCAAEAAVCRVRQTLEHACHFLGQAGKRALLTFIKRGALRLEALSVEDVQALDDLLARYERMDFADATLVLIAERTGIAEIFTIDRRDFEGYRTRSGRRFRLLLA